MTEPCPYCYLPWHEVVGDKIEELGFPIIRIQAKFYRKCGICGNILDYLEAEEYYDTDNVVFATKTKFEQMRGTYA